MIETMFVFECQTSQLPLQLRTIHDAVIGEIVCSPIGNKWAQIVVVGSPLLLG